ncbi:FadR/GntR family transcriptional regulator [uncultured Hoeflea sp.]|uniref:FadR/GntR family transcriptional regulator n=1 Tax=uncultured Hoeflea sp. TaxID=538666 RepID=UPI0030DBB6B1
MDRTKSLQPPGSRLVRQVRVYRQIADNLESRIALAEFEPGQRLPTERELARDYGVSRTCVREALLALEIAGLVTIRVGSGVFVNAPPSPDTAQARPHAVIDQHSPSDLLQARLALEPEVCGLAAVNATPGDIEAIESFLQKMREEHRMATETEQGDREFHFAIARATQNPVLVQLIQRIWDEMTGPMWQGLQKHVRSPILRLRWIEDHEAIVKALRSGERRRAQTAMRAHIRNVISAFDKARFP